MNRFAVKSGDHIGLRFEGNAGLIPFNFSANKHVYVSPSQNQAPNVGQTVVFGRVPVASQFSLAVLLETGDVFFSSYTGALFSLLDNSRNCCGSVMA